MDGVWSKGARQTSPTHTASPKWRRFRTAPKVSGSWLSTYMKEIRKIVTECHFRKDLQNYRNLAGTILRDSLRFENQEDQRSLKSLTSFWRKESTFCLNEGKRHRPTAVASRPHDVASVATGSSAPWRHSGVKNTHPLSHSANHVAFTRLNACILYLWRVSKIPMKLAMMAR